MYKRVFGERLRSLANEKEMTSMDVAKLLGVDRQEVFYLANGYKDPSLKTIAKLAEKFEVNAGFLIGTEGRQLTERQKLIKEFFDM